MLTLIDPIANTTETETDHFTQFALFGPATGEIVAAANEYVILDPDHGGANPGGQVTYPPAFAAVEKTFNLDVAQRVKQKLAACSVAVDMTRDTDTTVSSAARAAFINSRRPNLAMTLAFNTAYGFMWGDPGGWPPGPGGVQGLIDLSQSADVALVNRTRGHVALLGVSNHRPNLDARTWPLCGGNCVGTNVPGIKFAQMELAFMDNIGDRGIMDGPGGMDAFANAIYNSIIEELGLVGKCNLLPPPSADQINQWRALGYQNWLRYRGDPVTTSTGNHIQQFRLLHVPGRGGLDVDITLTYNSLDDRAGDFGYGWSWPYGAKLARYRDEGVTIQHADGQTHYYAFDGSNYTAPAGIFDRLVRNNDSSYTLTRPDQSTMRFDDQGRLQAITDRHGNTISLSYNGAQLTTITDTAGRTFNITYTGNTISRITDPLGRTLNFGYTGQDLTGITDPNQGTRRFEYDGQHHMTKLVDPENITYLRNIYDNQGRVVEQIDASGTHSYFTYQADRTIFTDNLGHQTTDVYDAMYRVVETIDANNQSTRYQYDSAYNLVKSTDARGYATLYEYDSRGNQRKRTDPIDNLSALHYSTDVTTWEYNSQNDLTKTTDALGHSTTFDYDTQGNLTAIHAPGGRNTTFIYNSWGQPTRMTDPNNHTTLYEYDTYGNLIKTTDAEGNVSTSTYDLVGRETAYTDANGHTARFAYDGNDNITRITDPKGKPTDFVYNKNDLLTQTTDRRGGLTRYEYDENLKLTAEIDPEGYRTEYDYDLMYNRVWMKNARGHITRYQYDPLYRLTHMTDANNHLTRYEYDPDGNLTAVIDALTQRTEMRYDAVNRLKYLQDTLNGQTEYIYDAEDQLTRLIDPRQAATGYEYDAVGNLVRLIDPLGKATAYQYDLADNLRFVTDPNNHTREYVYDRIDRLIRERDPLGHESQIHYDPVGNILTRIDPRGNETNFAYDENGNLVSATDALVNSIFYQYDAEDNQIALIDQRSHATYFGYDLRGLMVGVHEPGNQETLFEYDGNANLVGLTNAKGQITRYSYDPVDLLVKETDPLGAETHYSYDALNRLTQATDAEGRPTAYGYDALDRLNRVIDALNGVTHYGYDPVGNLIQITDANNQITHFEYNLRNELVKEINPLNHTWAYSYDDAGNLITRLDANGQPTHYDYDAADQLIKIRYPSAIGSSGLEVSFAYDEAGNEISMSDWNGLTTHQYDTLNRRTQTVNFDGATLAYTYDKTSNLTGLTYPNGQTVAYGYDARNLLTSLTDPLNQTTTFDHDPLGALTRITRPNGANTELSYDAANRLVNLSHKKDGAAFSAFAYALDKVGNRTQIAELRTFSGSPVPVATLKSYDYDALYRLVGAATDKGQDVAYSYDAVGNRQKQEGIPQAVDPTDGLEPLRPALPISATYTYNAANQLTAVNSLASTTGLTYDNNGNRLSQTEVLTDGTSLLTDYVYDHENRLVGVTKAISAATTITPTLVATYTYDGYGRRVKKEVAGPVTHHASRITYLYNGLDPIADTETVGRVTTATHYLWANGGIAEIIRQPNPAAGFPGDLYWTHTDGLGSLVDLTDAAGDSASQVYYDEYGQPLTDFHSLTRYSYTGQEFDPETGLYHFYARYYDPEFGVWLGQDLYRGNSTNPLSLHRYGYVRGNPINLTDTYGYYWGEKWINKGTKALNDHANPFNSNSTVRKKVLNPTGKWVYDNRAEIAETLTNVAVSSLVVAGGTAIIVASGGTATPLVLAGLGALGGGLGGGLGKIVKNKINDNKWNKGVIEEIAWGTALGAIPLDKVPGLKKLNKFIDKKLFRYAATGAPAKVWWKRFVGKRAVQPESRGYRLKPK